MKTLALTLMILISLTASAETPAETSEERNCKVALTESAKEEATMLLGENYFPEEVVRQIDTSKDLKCSAEIVRGSLRIEDRNSTFCQATAKYTSECFFPKKGGGYISETIRSSGSGCCMIE